MGDPFGHRGGLPTFSRTRRPACILANHLGPISAINACLCSLSLQVSAKRKYRAGISRSTAKARLWSHFIAPARRERLKKRLATGCAGKLSDWNSKRQRVRQRAPHKDNS